MFYLQVAIEVKSVINIYWCWHLCEYSGLDTTNLDHMAKSDFKHLKIFSREFNLIHSASTQLNFRDSSFHFVIVQLCPDLLSRHVSCENGIKVFNFQFYVL